MEETELNLENNLEKEFITEELNEEKGHFRNEESIHSASEPCLCDHQFSMNVADYQLCPVIGFGSSAIVYMAKYLPLSLDVAVKMIELDHFERNRIDELRKEIQVMAFCKHPNLLGILTSFVHESKLWIVTPFLSGGSCLDIMKSGFKDGFDEAAIATILMQALQGLEYLHENGHIHRDVKCGNLLMAEDGLVQLADFGVSSSLMEDGERHGVRKTYVGTPCWMAPEVMEITRGYDFKADIWSFGITALELAYGHAPYAKFPPMKVIYLTISGKPPTLDKKQASRKYSRMFKDMIDCCLQRDPAKRPTAKALLKHPFFKAMTKKPHSLVSSVLSHIPSVNLRDKSAQLRARGLPVPVANEEGGGGGDDGNDGGDYANKSFLSQAVTSAAEDDYNEDTSDSWDFSIDNSVEPDAPATSSLASAFDVIAEEEEEELETETIPSDSVFDPLPDARPLDEGDASFHGLQKNRTSRFILAADAEIKEAIGRLDLSSTVVSNEHESNDIVGSVNENIQSNSSTSSSSSEGTLQTVPSYHGRSASPNDANDAVPTEVKKGRFSVLEAVNSSDIDPIPENDLLESGGMITNHNNGSPSANSTSASNNNNNNNNNNSLNYHEEEKRSRFEVSLNVPVTETSDSEDPESGKNEENESSQQIYPGNMYHNSAPMISGPTYAPYPISHPSQQYMPSTSAYYPTAPPGSIYPSHSHATSIHHHRPSLTSAPFYPSQSPHPTATSVPLSPINHAQLDHLLHVNDYIRNQLVELKYRQELLQLQFHQQQQQQQLHHQQQQQQQQQQQYSLPGMRPHSSFNPHNYSSNPEMNHQLHHSHPMMPPVNNSINEPFPSYSIDHHHLQQNCYCCPTSSSNHQSNQVSMSNSVSPAPVDFNFILKELENIKKENEMLKSYLQQQQQQQQPQ